MPPTDPPTDPRVESLARDIERVSRRVDAAAQDLPALLTQVGSIEEHIEDLANMVIGLAEKVSATPATPAAEKESMSWLQVRDFETALAILTDLVAWLDSVYLWYTKAELPVCWLWHPTVIEELWWLRNDHTDAHSGRGWAARAGMWHHQQLPGVIDRIRQATSTCDLDQHIRATKPRTAPLAEHIGAVAAAWVSTGLPPEPLDEQLEHARQHEDPLVEGGAA